MTTKWWQKSVIYQIYPRSFYDANGDGIGDLQGIKEKLPYLERLGIDVIWLSPVYKSPNDDNGYDISDYEAIMEDFGTMADFDALLKAAHEKGIRIVMDLVVNHTSDEHAWFAESRKSVDNPKRDWYIWRVGKDGAEPNNYGSAFSGSAWEKDPETDMYYLHLFSKKQPDLNWANKDMRNALYAMMHFWLDKGIDGFRMDVISLIDKDQTFPDGETWGNAYAGLDNVANGKNVHTYLREMHQKVLSKYDIMTVGETTCVDIDEAVKYAGLDGKELNMVFSFEHMELDNCAETWKWVKKRVNLLDYKKNLAKWQNALEGKAWNSLYHSNHDQPRVLSRFGNDAPEYREVSAKMLATYLHFLKGTPYIYQGEELGMINMPFESPEDFRDIEAINAYADLISSGAMTKAEAFEAVSWKSRDNARTPMQWDATEHAGFTTGTPWIRVNPAYKDINAADAMAREDSVFHYYRKLIALRHERAVITEGDFTLLDPDHPYAFVYSRETENEKLICFSNFTEKTFSYPLPEQADEILIANYKDRKDTDKTIRPYEAFVIQVQK